MKACSCCHIVQELSAFGNNRNNPDGLQNRCRGCSKQQRENNKKKNAKRDFSDILELDCTKCLLVKSVSEFVMKPNGARCFEYWCKQCQKEYRKVYRIENADHNLIVG